MRKLKTIEMNRLSVDEFREAEKLPLVVVLDDVRSMYNVGSVLRTSDAFRVEEVVLCGITGRPPHPEIHKTALGAEDSVNWRHCPSALEAVRELQSRGYFVYAVEQAEGSTKLHEFPLPTSNPSPLTSHPSLLTSHPSKAYAIVLGNEVKGVHQEVVDACDGCLEIQQFGTKHSMNVAVTAGIVIWEFARRMMYNGC